MKKVVLSAVIIILVFSAYMLLLGDQRVLKMIEGNYQEIENNDYIGKWHLYIGKYLNKEHYFTIYDNGGKIGNTEFPWITGWIEKTDKKRIIINITDERLFHSVASEWKMENGKLVLDYKKDGETIELSNGGVCIWFKEQKFKVNNLIP